MLNKILFLMSACLIFVSTLCMAADTPAKGPQAILAKGVHEFEPVVEGSQVVHEFVLRNQGDEVLKIIDIKSG